MSFGINQCVANLTAGFIDLATYDELEKYMYGGPRRDQRISSVKPAKRRGSRNAL